MTLNAWKQCSRRATSPRWPQRRAAVAALARTFQPDVLVLQEASAEVLETLDEALPRHERVRGAKCGWETEGSIYFSADLLSHWEHGEEDVGITPASYLGRKEPERRLFWARLQPRLAELKPLLLSTAHLTYPGTADEQAAGTSPRVAQANNIRDALARLIWWSPSDSSLMKKAELKAALQTLGVETSSKKAVLAEQLTAANSSSCAAFFAGDLNSGWTPVRATASARSTWRSRRRGQRRARAGSAGRRRRSTG